MHDQPNQPGDPDNSNTAPLRQDPVIVFGYDLSYDFSGNFSFLFYRGGRSTHTHQAAGRNHIGEDIDGLRVWKNDDGTYGWEAEEHGWFDRNGNGEYDQGDLDLSPGQGKDNIDIFDAFDSPSDFLNFLEDKFNTFDNAFV